MKSHFGLPWMIEKFKGQERQGRLNSNPKLLPAGISKSISNIFAGYSASVYTRIKPKPVILGVDPSTGKPGDHIVITGENFMASPDSRATVVFPGTQIPSVAK